jgi:Lrp/AsnC family leucine-responsive transcriptional regulator
MRTERGKSNSVDALDLSILEKMLVNGRITFKELAKVTRNDQRTIASRYQRLVNLGIIEAVTVQIDWSKIGLTAMAIMGTRTVPGGEERDKLIEYVKKEGKVLEAFSTIGSHEYILRVIDKDISALRKEVASPLEPLTAGLDTSLVVERLKSPDYTGLMRYLEGKVAHSRKAKRRKD